MHELQLQCESCKMRFGPSAKSSLSRHLPPPYVFFVLRILIPARTVDSPNGWTASSLRWRPGTWTTLWTAWRHSSSRSPISRRSSVKVVELQLVLISCCFWFLQYSDPWLLIVHVSYGYLWRSCFTYSGSSMCMFVSFFIFQVYVDEDYHELTFSSKSLLFPGWVIMFYFSWCYAWISQADFFCLFLLMLKLVLRWCWACSFR